MTLALVAAIGLAALVVSLILLTSSRRLTWWFTCVLVALAFNEGLLGRYFAQLASSVRLAIDGLALSLVLATIVAQRFRTSNRLGGRDIAVLAFVGVAAISALNTEVPTVLAGVEGFRLTGAFFLLYLVGETLQQRRTIVLFLAAAAPSLLLGLRQAAFGLNSAEIAQIESQRATYLVGDTYRLIGSAPTGQEFSFQLLLMLAVALAALRTGIGNRYLVAVYACLAVLITIGTLQRSGLLGVLAIVAFFVLVGARGSRARTAGRVLAAAVAVALLVSPLVAINQRAATSLDRLSSLSSVGNDYSFGQRVQQVWPKALNAIRERPLLGWGAGAAGAPSVKHAGAYPLGPMVTDNQLLHIGVQYGLVGIALWLIFAFLSLRATTAQRRAPSATWLAGALALVGLLAAGISGSYVSMINMSGLVLMLLGARKHEVTQTQSSDSEPQLAASAVTKP